VDNTALNVTIFQLNVREDALRDRTLAG